MRQYFTPCSVCTYLSPAAVSGDMDNCTALKGQADRYGECQIRIPRKSHPVLLTFTPEPLYLYILIKQCIDLFIFLQFASLGASPSLIRLTWACVCVWRRRDTRASSQWRSRGCRLICPPCIDPWSMFCMWWIAWEETVLSGTQDWRKKKGKGYHCHISRKLYRSDNTYSK